MMRAQEGMNSYSQGDLQRMIRQVSDLYTQTAEATAKELEDSSALSEAGGENFKVCMTWKCLFCLTATYLLNMPYLANAGGNQGQTTFGKRAAWLQTI